MRIAAYSCFYNAAQHAERWASSCAEADERVVTITDDGTDGTAEILTALGVTVHYGRVVPFRADDQQNVALAHVGPDIDACIRLDCDETLQPGWRAAVEAAWVPPVNSLMCRYVYSWRPDGSPELVFPHCRTHSRVGWRWQGATHEGLFLWSGTGERADCPGLEIHHHHGRQGKPLGSQLGLLQVAVNEAPHDARMRFYLARELHYVRSPDRERVFKDYLAMPGGLRWERTFAMRVLYEHTRDISWLKKATLELPEEADSWQLLAQYHHDRKEWRECLINAQRALRCTFREHTNNPAAIGLAYDLAGCACWWMDRKEQAREYGAKAAELLPHDARVIENAAFMARALAA